MRALLARARGVAFGRGKRKSLFPPLGLEVLHALSLRAIAAGCGLGLGLVCWGFVCDTRVELRHGGSPLLEAAVEEVPQLNRQRYNRTFYLPWAGAERAAAGRWGDRFHLPLVREELPGPEPTVVGGLRRLGVAPWRQSR